MNQTTNRILVTILMLAVFFIAGGGMISAKMTGFLVTASNGVCYEFNKDELNNSYLMYQLRPDSGEADLYRQFAGIKGGKVVAFRDDSKGWMDYEAAQSALLKAQILGQTFDINTFAESAEAPVYSGAVSEIVVVTPGMVIAGIDVSYQCFIESQGWSDFSENGQVAGTIGQARPLKALKMRLVDPPSEAKIKFRLYRNGLGWQECVSDGELPEVEVLDNNIEAITIELENMPDYSVEYQVKIIGHDDWQHWVWDGAMAGTEGMNLAIEAFRVRIVQL